jgi:uncharacterized membrane protein YfcA
MDKVRFYHPRQAIRDAAALAAIGLLAGIANGLLGAGGGIIVVLALGKLYAIATAEAPAKGTIPAHGDTALTPRDIYATSLVCMLPVSMLSALQYAGRGEVSFSDFSPYLLPAIVGGVVGGLVLDRVQLPYLRRLFAFLLLVTGVRMLLK